MDDILLIDKPKGITSFDVIRILRRKLGIRKMGHAGTLDPLASGLMIIGIEKGTKKLNDFLRLPKVYEAEVLLGKKTTTGDMEGEVLESKKITEINLKEIEKTLKEMTGKIILPVPLYSAVKIKGKALYKHARKGTDIKPPEKEMEIFCIKLKDDYKKENCHVLVLELEVASGTYIRSIAEELGKRLGFPATLQNLRRTKIGDFKISDAQKLDLTF